MKYLVAGLVTVGIAVHIWVLSQLRFEVWPEMMVMPFLQQNGFELYRDMIVPWTPGLMWILNGWFGIFGLSVERLKLFTWILIAGIDLLIYLIAKKKWGEKAGVAALGFYVLLQPVFDGNGLWFDLAAVPLLLGAFYHAGGGVNWRQPLFLGPAFLIKQSTVWLSPIFLIDCKKRKYQILTLFSVFGISSLWFLNRGTLSDYLYWAYSFTFLKLPAMTGHRDLGSWRMWATALAPFALLGGIRGIRGKRGIREIAEDPLWWAVLSIPFALPRFGLFHFQPAVAFLALAAGKLYNSYKNYKYYKIIAVVGVLYMVFVWHRTIVFQWQKADRFLEPEVYQLAAEVALTTRKDEPVLLVNAPELVYVLADRLPPKPWLTQFPWFLELPGFQEELVEKFKNQNLHQIVIEPYKNEGDFIPGSYRPKILLDYVNKIK